MYIFSLSFQPFFLFCVTAVEFSFALPLYFVNSLRPCWLSLSFFPFCRQLFSFFVFTSRSFPFLRHCCLIVFGSSTVFRQFSTSLFPFSVVLCHSYVSSLIFLSLSFVLPLFCVTASYCLSFIHG